MLRSLPLFISFWALLCLSPSLLAEEDSEPREWRDQSGVFSLEATIVGVERKDGVPLVKLRKSDGSVVAVPYAKLSQDDQKFSVEWYQGQKSAPKKSQGKRSPVAGDEVKLHWGSKWWNGSIVEVDGERLKVHYDGWGDNWDEWKTADQLRWRDDSPVIPGGPADPSVAAADPAKPAASKSLTPDAGAKSTARLLPAPPTRSGRSHRPAFPPMPAAPRMSTIPRIPPVPRIGAAPRAAAVAKSTAEASPTTGIEIGIPDRDQQASPSASPQESSTFPAGLTPQQTRDYLKDQLLAGNLQAFWEWLPGDFRVYLNSREHRERMKALSEDDDDHPGLEVVLTELVVVMREKKEFLLKSPLLSTLLKTEENNRLLREVYDPATDLLDEFTQLMANVDAEIRSEHFDAAFRQRLDRLGPNIAAVLQSLSSDVLQSVWDCVEVKPSEPNGGQLVMTYPGGPEKTYELTQVDGRWLPRELVDVLSAIPEKLQKKVAKRKAALQGEIDAETFRDQMAKGFQAGLHLSLAEGLQELAAANTQQEFDAGIEQLVVKVQLLSKVGL